MIQLSISGTEDTYTVAPSKIIALGMNYMAHVEEDVLQGDKELRERPPEPILFPKTPNVLIGPGEPIVIPAFIKDYHFDKPQVDYEAELAVIIGKQGKNVPAEDALDYVFGYTCMNDVSQRNIQKGDKSGWFRGKSLDTFGPIGPQIVKAGDIADPQNLDIRCRLNGELVQDSSTRLMIFPISETIAFISKQITLEEGDIIMTGTPSGVGSIRHGDVVEVEVEGIGVLRNPVVEE